MDEYLSKPFTDAALWAAIDRVLTSRPLRQPPRLDLLDPPVLLAACGGDPAMLRKMCRSLQSRVPEYLAAIRDALHDQDALRIREAAHKFYGMLSAFSTAAGDQAADLEDLAARRLLPEALPIVEQLDRCATELARLAGGLTIETLRKQTEPADDPNWTAGPTDGRRETPDQSVSARPGRGPPAGGQPTTGVRCSLAVHLGDRSLLRQCRCEGIVRFRESGAGGHRRWLDPTAGKPGS